MPQEVQILLDHPRALEDKHLEADNWFDLLKLSQKKYLDNTVVPTSIIKEAADNLTISSKFAGILAMQFDTNSNTIKVVQNPWRKTVAEFNGAFVTKKFNK